MLESDDVEGYSARQVWDLENERLTAIRRRRLRAWWRRVWEGALGGRSTPAFSRSYTSPPHYELRDLDEDGLALAEEEAARRATSYEPQ